MIFDDLKHAQRQRLIFLDRCLNWRGIANRRDLMGRFGISMAQAALDFRAYLSLASVPPVYDRMRKTYVAAAGHEPLVPSSLTEALDVLVDSPGESILPKPERKADPAIISRLHQAIQAGRQLHLRYTSMTSGADEGQWIAPVRFTSDGESVHLRAFGFKHGEYRNYLPVRIEPNSSFQERDLAEPLPRDEDWHTRANIFLAPKSGLSREQAKVVRREFGFEDEFLLVQTRKALEFFIDRRWGLQEAGARLERVKTVYEPLD